MRAGKSRGLQVCKESSRRGDCLERLAQKSAATSQGCLAALPPVALNRPAQVVHLNVWLQFSPSLEVATLFSL
jgi:hypothetical protein